MSQYLDKDGASRIAENFLLKQAEQDSILRNLQFDLKEAEHALVKTVQGPAPLNIRALTRPLDDYLINGNTLQGGTPTPEAPVDVVGCGARTGNLFDKSEVKKGYYVNDITGNIEPSSTALNASDYIYIGGMSKVYIGNQPTNKWGAFYDSAKAYVSGFTAYGSVTVPTNAAYVRITVLSANLDDMMINSGSTALPYEPYGFKLPLTVNGTEYPIYLGQVETTRKIKKLVLTGNENWAVGSANYYSLLQSKGRAYSNALCTHAKNATTIDNNGNYLYLQKSAFVFDTLADFKSYLAQQYQNGTPVTIRYVLAEPETAVVNEPLHKIGNYADTISYAQSDVEISTTKGFNTITTDTAVLPSNIEVKGVINNA